MPTSTGDLLRPGASGKSTERNAGHVSGKREPASLERLLHVGRDAGRLFRTPGRLVRPKAYAAWALHVGVPTITREQVADLWR